MTCTTCGHANQFDAQFCSQCATQLSKGSTPVDPSSPRPVGTPYNPYAGAAPYTPSFAPHGAYAPPPPASGNATAALVLGILSLAVCSIMGPIAWAIGKGELDKIRSGQSSPAGQGSANAGMICGIIGTVILGLTLVWVMFILAH